MRGSLERTRRESTPGAQPRNVPNMLPPVVLFDLDDTLLDYGLGAETLWDEVVAEFERRIPRDSQAVRGALDASRRWFWDEPERSRRGRLDMLGARRAIVRRAFEQLALVADETALALADRYTWAREDRVAPLPGAIETVRAVRASGRRVGLVTNGASVFQRRKLERWSLAPQFDAIAIEGELGFGKPDPRAFLHALAVLGADPREAWMVGNDLEADIGGARATGIHTVWVDHAGAGAPADAAAQPDRIVRSVAELRTLL